MGESKRHSRRSAKNKNETNRVNPPPRAGLHASLFIYLTLACLGVGLALCHFRNSEASTGAVPSGFGGLQAFSSSNVLQEVSGKRIQFASNQATPVPEKTNLADKPSRTSIAKNDEQELITLDPICATIEPTNPKLAPGKPAPSTQKMAELLHKLTAKAYKDSMYLSDFHSQVLREQLDKTTDLSERIQLEFQLGNEEINSARPDVALNTFTDLEKYLAQAKSGLDPRSQAELQLHKGLAFLRLGEQENCLANHNADSCLFPLEQKAYHLLPRGSRGAIATFTQHLKNYPDDLGARWLLNIAHMTLGEYPDKVDPRYLIPPDKFASEYQMPRFVDVSEQLGLDSNDLAGGTIVDDFDNDGFYDLVTSAWDEHGQLRLFHNNGDGTFTERTSEAGLVGEIGALNIQQTDYNNDGLLDIWMLRGAWLGQSGQIPNSLLRNNGDGTFTDVTEEAGLLSYHPTQTARWFDYDGDGWLDLFIGNETTDPRRPHYCELYHNNRDGTFTECARACGINVADFVKGVACADYDNDGRPDLFLSTDTNRPKILLHNDGPDAAGHWHFSNQAARAGVDTNIRSFGTFFFDYDNDGWEDLVVMGYYIPHNVADVAADYLGLPTSGEKTKLFHNNHDGTFKDVTLEAHLDRVIHTMGNNYGDLDNDGWLDFYCGTGDPDFRTLIPNRMFRNAEGKFFQDVTTATGTGHLQKGHGVSFADFNDDGAQDVYISIGGAYSGDYAKNALFLNPGTTNHWVKLKLIGDKANRAAIGARLTLNLSSEKGGRQISRTVSSGSNFGSNPLRQEIGLGSATSIASVEIVWPGSGTRQTITGLQADRAYEIRENQAQPSLMKLHPIAWSRPASNSNQSKLHANLPSETSKAAGKD